MPKLKKINLLNETILVNKIELSKAFSSNKQFGITINGNIKYLPFESHDIFIYQGQILPKTDTDSSIAKATNKHNLLGSNYQVLEKNDSILIKAGNAWQDIINYNVPHCDYNDTSGNEVTEFSDKNMEDMAWMLIDFDVTYKEIFEFLEKNVDITLLCIEDEEAYQFSGIGYFDNIATARKTFFNYSQSIIKDKLANDADYTYEYLDEDQIEAVEYFQAR